MPPSKQEERKCKCRPCNPKRKVVRVKIPKGYNWTKSDNTGKQIIIEFVEIY